MKLLIVILVVVLALLALFAPMETTYYLEKILLGMERVATDLCDWLWR